MHSSIDPVPIPRRMDFPFDASIPRWWMMESPLGTHLANGLNLLFPWGERFFVRSVRHYLDELDDPELRERVRGFFGQEGHHAREHERFFQILEEQGYEIRPFLDGYTAASAAIERNSHPALNLAITVAAEHFTAMFAERAFRKGFLDECHPTMRDLLAWHAAEEIEHKSVAFDVLRAVNPSYALRMAGLVAATVLLVGWWMRATAMLLAQEDESVRAGLLAQVEEGRRRGSLLDGSIPRAFLRYMHPRFHPSQTDNEHFAHAWLAKIGARPT